MEGLVDNRPAPDDDPALEVDDDEAHVRFQEAMAPRAVKVVFTPMTRTTLATVVTQEWNGRLRVDTRVLATNLASASRLDWALDPWRALLQSMQALAGTIEP